MMRTVGSGEFTNVKAHAMSRFSGFYFFLLGVDGRGDRDLQPKPEKKDKDRSEAQTRPICEARLMRNQTDDSAISSHGPRYYMSTGHAFNNEDGNLGAIK
jgi:hypothetical protein